MSSTEFFKGDRVEIRVTGSEWHGHQGTVSEADGANILVLIGGAQLLFAPSELQLISSPFRNHKSPQYRR